MQAKKVRGPEPAVSVMVNKFLHLNKFAHDRRTPLEHRRPKRAVVVVDSSGGTVHGTIRHMAFETYWKSCGGIQLSRWRLVGCIGFWLRDRRVDTLSALYTGVLLGVCAVSATTMWRSKALIVFHQVRTHTFSLLEF